jgi:hypothetical protein
MGKFTFAALAAAASMVLAPAAAQAQTCWSGPSLEAVKLRQLDVMLMVSALRCRTGADNFQADYERFLDHNRTRLSAANNVILSSLSVKMGRAAAFNELDKMSVSIANHYGQAGDMTCRDLRQVASDLADTSVAAALGDAADALVSDDVIETSCSVRVASRK